MLEQQLQRQAEQAYRQRSLRFFQEGAKVRFDGCLPRPEAERWMAQLDACQAQQRRIAIETRDRLADTTPEQRRADALIALIQTGAGPSAVGRGEHAGGTGNGDPNKNHGHGSQPDSAIEDGKATGAEGRGQSEAGMAGPTARVLVKLDYDRLVDGAAAAGLLVDGQPLSAGELRRLCCDAEVIPIVLGAESEILDVGRTQRLVTPALRAALVQRDGGCVFPGCDAPPSRCEAHHVVPWYLGGPTELWNLVLLCHHHHPVVEPARYAFRDQWQVQIAEDGVPEFIPPARLDPQRRPVRHRRHTADVGPPSQGAGAGPPGDTQGIGPPNAA